MVENKIDRFEAVFRQIGDPNELDDYSIKNFRHVVSVHLDNPPKFLFTMKVKLGEEQKEDLFHALLTRKNKDKMRLYFTEPQKEIYWGGYVKPVILIELAGDRSYIYRLEADENGMIRSKEVVKEEALVRFYVRSYIYPESIKSYSLRGFEERKINLKFKLFMLDEFIEFLSTAGLFPIEIGIVAYTKNERYHYVCDLLWNGVKLDPRCEKLPSQLRIEREMPEYLVLDTIIANPELYEDSKIILETVFESNSVTYMELLDILGISSDKLDAYLNSMESKKWIKKEGKYPKTVYLIDDTLIARSEKHDGLD